MFARTRFKLVRFNTVKSTCFNQLFTLNVSKMATSLKKPWDFIYVCAPDSPVYINRVNSSSFCENESESRNGNDNILTRNSSREQTHILVFPKKSSNLSSADDMYVASAIEIMQVFRQSVNWSRSVFCHCIQASLDGNFMRRGVYINTGCQESTSKILEMLNENANISHYELSHYNKPNFYRMVIDPESNDNSNNKADNTANDDDEVILKITDKWSLGNNQPGLPGNDGVSPIFGIPSLSPVYQDYHRARSLLVKLSDTPEVQKLLDIVDKHVDPHILTKTDDPERTLKHPFIVVEGMDATGKTTLTEELERSLGAARYFSPPPQVTHLRAFFDQYPEIVRRAYYYMGNYIVAEDIIRECQSRPVILDRFWQSTAAYGIANMTTSADMPPVGHPVYTWPSDLLKPTLGLFLTVSEDVRKQRLSGRGMKATFEEKSLNRDQLFRQRLCEAYRRMHSPSLLEIDAGGTIEEVGALAVNTLRKHGIKLDTQGNSQKSM